MHSCLAIHLAVQHGFYARPRLCRWNVVWFAKSITSLTRFGLPRRGHRLFWQHGFFLVNCLVLRHFLASVRSGVVKTFRCQTLPFSSSCVLFPIGTFLHGGSFPSWLFTISLTLRATGLPFASTRTSGIRTAIGLDGCRMTIQSLSPPKVTISEQSATKTACFISQTNHISAIRATPGIRDIPGTPATRGSLAIRRLRPVRPTSRP